MGRSRRLNNTSGMARRSALKVIGGVPAALAASSLKPAPAAGQVQENTTPAEPGKPAYKPGFFSEREWKAANELADMIIPKDSRSGSASDAAAVEYIDEFAVFKGEELQTQLRGGLTWLDRECRKRFEREFIECTIDQRSAVLDDIAYPDRSKREYSQAIEFFRVFRELAVTGFYTSRIGMADLGYLGNRPFPWQGCPEEVLAKLGLP